MDDGRLEAFSLSHESLAHAASLVRDVTLADDLGCRIQFDVSGTRWHLVVDRGRVTSWDLGDADDPEVEVRWSAADARRILTRELRGSDALTATTVHARVGGDRYVGTPAPANLLNRPELAAMPSAPGATFGVHYVYSDGPFGDVDYSVRFHDGRPVEERLDALAEPDVFVDVTYRAMAQVRAGEITILDAIDGRIVKGDLGPLAALAGISESPEFHAAELATGRHALALAVLGELDAEPAFAAACAHLAGATTQP